MRRLARSQPARIYVWQATCLTLLLVTAARSPGAEPGTALPPRRGEVTSGWFATPAEALRDAAAEVGRRLAAHLAARGMALDPDELELLEPVVCETAVERFVSALDEPAEGSFVYGGLRRIRIDAERRDLGEVRATMYRATVAYVIGDDLLERAASHLRRCRRDRTAGRQANVAVALLATVAAILGSAALIAQRRAPTPPGRTADSATG